MAAKLSGGVARDCRGSDVGRTLRRSVRPVSNSRRRGVCLGSELRADRGLSERLHPVMSAAAVEQAAAGGGRGLERGRQRLHLPRSGGGAVDGSGARREERRNQRGRLSHHQLVPDEQRGLHHRLRSGRRLGGDVDSHNGHRADHRRRRRDQRRRFQLGRSRRRASVYGRSRSAERLDRGLRPSPTSGLDAPCYRFVAGCASPARQHRTAGRRLRSGFGGGPGRDDVPRLAPGDTPRETDAGTRRPGRGVWDLSSGDESEILPGRRGDLQLHHRRRLRPDRWPGARRRRPARRQHSAAPPPPPPPPPTAARPAAA